jgi:hypothetical protein
MIKNSLRVMNATNWWIFLELHADAPGLEVRNPGWRLHY